MTTKPGTPANPTVLRTARTAQRSALADNYGFFYTALVAQFVEQPRRRRCFSIMGRILGALLTCGRGAGGSCYRLESFRKGECDDLSA